MAAITQYLGTGRRKKSIARVRLLPGTGVITINGRDNYKSQLFLKVFLKIWFVLKWGLWAIFCETKIARQKNFCLVRLKAHTKAPFFRSNQQTYQLINNQKRHLKKR